LEKNKIRPFRTLLLIGFFCCLFLQVRAQEKGKLEVFVDRIYRIIEGDSAAPKKQYYFALPIWGIAPETGWKLGLSLGTLFRVSKDTITRPSLIRLNTQYTQYKQFSFRPTADIFFKHNEYNLKAQFIYNNFNEKYWGIGNQTDNNPEWYDFKLNRFNARFTKQIYPNWFLGPQVQFEKLYDLKFSDTSSAPKSGVTGINGYESLGLGLALAFDNRSHIYYPKEGVYLEISSYAYRPAWSASSFTNLTIDLRKYHALWKDNVLAGQLYSNLNWGNVPYRQMGTMGNEMIMRGYYNGRYREHHMLAFQVELRKTIWGPLGMTFFGGGGNVGEDAKDLFSTFKPNYGFGFRAMAVRKEHINMRLDLGFGEKGIKGLYFTMSEAF
jgi:outer membrane protein assembly factor BamA